MVVQIKKVMIGNFQLRLPQMELNIKRMINEGGKAQIKIGQKFVWLYTRE